MRGTPADAGNEWIIAGIIPAHAGNTYVRLVRKLRKWDHPRACGEHVAYDRPCDAVVGSSPRMRGTPWTNQQTYDNNGIIPAHAGNTDDVAFVREDAGDHPRACGEHRAVVDTKIIDEGSSPRMRGTR